MAPSFEKSDQLFSRSRPQSAHLAGFVQTYDPISGSPNRVGRESERTDPAPAHAANSTRRGPTRNATIVDVAARADVSIKTVSRVMNGEGARPATREAVLAAAAALGYHPNLSARSLAGARSSLILLLVDADQAVLRRCGESDADLIGSIHLGSVLACREGGFHVLFELLDADPRLADHEVDRLLAAFHPDGVIVAPPRCDDPLLLSKLSQARLPLVRLGSERRAGGGLRMPLAAIGASDRVTGASKTFGWLAEQAAQLLIGGRVSPDCDQDWSPSTDLGHELPPFDPISRAPRGPDNFSRRFGAPSDPS